MGNQLYKGTLIIVFASRDKSGHWIPNADISWTDSGGCDHSQKITCQENHFGNRDDAEKRMTEIAKTWVDEHLES